MAVFGPNFSAGLNDLVLDTYTFANTGLANPGSSKFTIAVVVGGYKADHSDNTVVNAAIADVYDDTLLQVTSYHMYGQSGVTIAGSGCAIVDQNIYIYNGWEGNHPLWVRLVHCTGDIRNLTNVNVAYMCETQSNEGSWSTITLLPGRWELDSFITDQVITGAYQTVSFSSSSSATVYTRSQEPGSMRLFAGTLDGSNDEAPANRCPFVLGDPSGGYYSGTYYPQQIAYRYSWYDVLMMQFVPNIDASQSNRTLAWNVNSVSAPPGNPYTDNNNWLPSDAVSGNGNWAILDLTMTDF